MRIARRAALLAASLVLLFIVLQLATPPARPQARAGPSDGEGGDERSAPPKPSPVVARGFYKVTLITGDVVYVRVYSDDNMSVVAVEPADPTEKGRAFTIVRDRSGLYVIPSDVDLSKYDRELFNVAYLIREGYHNQSYLPLIVKGESLPILERVGKELASILKDKIKAKIISRRLAFQRLKVRVEALHDFFKKFKTLPGIVKVWLDKKVRVKLDYSVPHIGAPRVWTALGASGEGVTIAILDTGINFAHRDFTYFNGTSKIVAAASFVEWPEEEVGDPQDYHGHGTHCAAIAAGTGLTEFDSGYLSMIAHPLIARAAWDEAALMAGNGSHLVVVWHSDALGSWDIWYSIYDGYSWSPPDTVTTDPAVDSWPAVAILDDGSILVVWASNRTGRWSLWYSIYRGGSWTGDHELALPSPCDTANNTAPAVAQLSNGSIAIAWSTYNESRGTRDVIFAVYNLAGDTLNLVGARELTHTTGKRMYTRSVLQASDGRIWVFTYDLSNYNFTTHWGGITTLYYNYSDDGGATWSGGVLARGPGYTWPFGVELDNGTLLVFFAGDDYEHGVADTIYMIKYTGGSWGPVTWLRKDVWHSWGPSAAYGPGGLYIAFTTYAGEGRGNDIYIVTPKPRYQGVAPKANIMAGKVLNQYGWGYDSWIIEGIEWAVKNGADVISMSLGGGIGDGTDPLSQMCDWAVSQGVTVVVAAGNEGWWSKYFSISCPGCARDVITVGACDDYDNIADFSSGGPTIDYRLKPDVVAPGVDIMSAVPYSIYGTYYESWSGTSMATPHVAGLAALVIQRYGLRREPGTPQLIKSLIASTALTLEGYGPIEGGSRVVVNETYATPTLSKLRIFMDDWENNDEIYYVYEFTLVMSNGTEYSVIGQSPSTYGDIIDELSFDADNDGQPDLFKRIYMFAFTSDDDTLNVFVEAFNVTSSEWQVLYGQYISHNVLRTGAGRIDAAHATNASIAPMPAIVDFGVVSGERVVEREVELMSLSGEPLEVTFSVKVYTTGRSEDYSSNFWVEPQALVLGAGENATVRLVANLTGLPHRDYQGVVRIYANGTEVAHIVFTVFKYLNLTVETVNLAGEPDYCYVNILVNETSSEELAYYLSAWYYSTGNLSVMLPEGVYHVVKQSFEDGSVVFMHKVVELYSNQTVALDTREAHTVRLTKPGSTMMTEKSYIFRIPQWVDGWMWAMSIEIRVYYPTSSVDYISALCPGFVRYMYYDKRYADPSAPDLILAPEVFTPYMVLPNVTTDMVIDPQPDVTYVLRYKTFVTPKVATEIVLGTDLEIAYRGWYLWVWMGGFTWAINSYNTLLVHTTSYEAAGAEWAELFVDYWFEKPLPGREWYWWGYYGWFSNHPGSYEVDVVNEPEPARADIYVEGEGGNLTYVSVWGEALSADTRLRYYGLCDMNLRVYVNGELLLESSDGDWVYGEMGTSIPMPVDMMVEVEMNRSNGHSLSTYSVYRVIYHGLNFTSGQTTSMWLRPWITDVVINVEGLDMNNTVATDAPFHVWVLVYNESTIEEAWLEYSYGDELVRVEGSVNTVVDGQAVISFEIQPPSQPSFIDVRFNVSEGATYYCDAKSYEFYVEKAFYVIPVPVVPVAYTLADLPAPFVVDGVSNYTIIVADSGPHGPCDAASTIDVVSAPYVASGFTVAGGAQSNPESRLDWEVSSFNSTHVTDVWWPGHLVAIGGPGVNLVTRYYNWHAGISLPAYFTYDAQGRLGIYSTASGTFYTMEGGWYTGGEVRDYALIELIYDQAKNRYVLIVAGLSGFSTREAAKILGEFKQWNLAGVAVILEIYDSDSNPAHIDSVQIVEVINS